MLLFQTIVSDVARLNLDFLLCNDSLQTDGIFLTCDVLLFPVM